MSQEKKINTIENELEDAMLSDEDLDEVSGGVNLNRNKAAGNMNKAAGNQNKAAGNQNKVSGNRTMFGQIRNMLQDNR